MLWDKSGQILPAHQDVSIGLTTHVTALYQAKLQRRMGCPVWPLSGQSLMERLCCRASVPFKGRLSLRINWGYAGFGPISHKRENAATLFKDESPAE